MHKSEQQNGESAKRTVVASALITVIYVFLWSLRIYFGSLPIAEQRLKSVRTRVEMSEMRSEWNHARVWAIDVRKPPVKIRNTRAFRGGLATRKRPKFLWTQGKSS